MSDSQNKISAVILVGGHATEFRPLSLDVPKPLFPIAGKPMIYHHLLALSKVPQLEEVFLLGNLQEAEYQDFIKASSDEFKLKITYLFEEKRLGTGGGLFMFKDQILGDGSRETVFLLHSDICCKFPLNELLLGHKMNKGCITMMGKQVSKSVAMHYGCYVVDKEDTSKVVHYAEHPESFISDTVNGGVYVLSPEFFSAPLRRTPSKSNFYDYVLESEFSTRDPDVISLEHDVIPDLVSRGEMYAYMYSGFWRSIKNAGGAVYANEQYLSHFVMEGRELSKSTELGEYTILDGVLIHPSVRIDRGSVIGPNVYVGPNTVIAKGVRISNAIVLGDVAIHPHAFISYSIVSRGCTIGAWSRLEGIPGATQDVFEGADTRYRRMGITILGNDVATAPEIIVRDCIVLPHKSISKSVHNEIIL